MTLIKDHSLLEGWSTLDDEEKQSICSRLGPIMNARRSLMQDSQGPMLVNKIPCPLGNQLTTTT
jgi:hypothetical protein